MKNLKRMIVAFAGAVVLSLSLAVPAQAATYTGWKWYEPVTVTDNTGDPSLEVDRAVANWAKVGAPISMTGPGSTTAKITVQYAQLGDYVGANAQIYYISPDRMHACVISIDEEMRGASQDMKRKVVGHEMGHCIGLGHVIYDSIMSPRMFTAPTWRDKFFVRSLYHLKPRTR